MTTASSLLEPKIIDSNFEDNLDHAYCDCNPNLALCGTDISDAEDVIDIITTSDNFCAMCDEVLYDPCPYCKKNWEPLK